MRGKPTILVYNHKGGVGKTTTAAAIADGLRARGRRVLAVDCDPQGSLSAIQEAYVCEGTASTLAFLRGEGVVPTRDGQATVPAFEDLATIGDESGLYLTCLADAIDRAEREHGFDACVIDTPPAYSLTTIFAIAAATHVVIPTEPDDFSLKGLRQTTELIADLSETTGKDLEGRVGVLITKVRSMVSLHAQKCAEIAELCEGLGLRLFEDRIPLNAKIQQAQARHVPIFGFESVEHGAILKYRWAVDELCEWVRETEGI